jgi:predicted nucleic acid-binding protein
MMNSDMEQGPIAVLDACVLYSAALRDFFMWLGVWELYTPKWTERIQDEWSSHVIKNRSELNAENIKTTRQNMEKQFGRASVMGWESLESSLQLPDQKDRHVLAAAIKAKAKYIVTKNLKHFPKEILAQYGIEAIHPDDFAILLFERDPEKMLSAARQQRSRLRNPSKTVEEHLQPLAKQDMSKIADKLKLFIDKL